MDTIERRRFSRLGCALGAWCCALLVACGGGGDDVPTAPAGAGRVNVLQGVFAGTLTGPGSQDVILVTDMRGTLFAVYGTDAASDFKIAGLLTGWASDDSTTTRFRSDYGMDWGATVAGSIGVRIELSFDPAVPVMSGSATNLTGTRKIAGGALLADRYQFATPANLDVVRGHWELATSQGRHLSIDIDADGVITGTSGQCTVYSSFVKPDVSGNNVFSLQMRFRNGGLGCPAEPHADSDGVYGFALAYVPVGGGLQLVIGAENGWDPVYLAATGKR